MSTYCSTCLWGVVEHATVLRHRQGHPHQHGKDLVRFLRLVEQRCSDRRFDDPTYLAAKLVVFLARLHQLEQAGSAHPLDFDDLGVRDEEGGIDYRYSLHCRQLDERGWPSLECVMFREERELPITLGSLVAEALLEPLLDPWASDRPWSEQVEAAEAAVNGG